MTEDLAEMGTGSTETSAGNDDNVAATAVDENDDAVMIDTDPTDPQLAPSTSAAAETPSFPPLSESAKQAALAKKSETRRIPIPPHRMTPLKKDWINVFGPLTEILGLQVRMNVQRRCVEVRVSVAFHLPQSFLVRLSLQSA